MTNTTERVLNAASGIWKAYNEHPFVLGIQNGTLDKEKFRYYIMQDFLCLKDYAKTFAVGAAKAKSIETAQLFAKYIALIHEEMDIHSGYMGKLHVTQDEINRMSPSLDNLSYTSYMLRMAARSSKSRAIIQKCSWLPIICSCLLYEQRLKKKRAYSMDA